MLSAGPIERKPATLISAVTIHSLGKCGSAVPEGTKSEELQEALPA